MLSSLISLAAVVSSSAAAALPTSPPPSGPWAKDRRMDAGSSQDFGPLTFDSKGEFQICIFEDLHFGESESFRSHVVSCSYVTPLC